MTRNFVPKVIALLIGAAQCFFYVTSDQGHVPGRLVSFVIVCEVLIWFPDSLGSMLGWAGGVHAIDKPTPGCFIAGLGWFGLLVFVPGFYWVLLEVGK